MTKIKELSELSQALTLLSNEKTPIFYEIAKNQSILKRVLDPEFNDFNEARKRVIEELSVKNEDGTTKTDEKGQIDFGENTAEAVKLLTEGYQQLLDKEIDVDLFKISESNKKRLSEGMWEASKLQPIIDYLY